ncbi:RadC family protein [Eggerthia catenaformis]|uniref:RadC family protein n=1 Tax=Eggerthia catenaformis TaxID=31973 RepID=UPI003C6FFC4F
MIKNIPIEENPREKALVYGIDSLSNNELLAVLLRTGSKDETVLELSSRVINCLGGLNGFKTVTYKQLTDIKGIKQAKALEVLAAIELAIRIGKSNENRILLNCPSDIYYYLRDEMRCLKQEHFKILILDTKHRLIKEKTLFIGLVNMSLVSPREVYMEALSVNGAAIAAIHNHPTGDSSPSKEDEMVTKTMKEAGRIMNIEFIDHIIIGYHEFYSFMANRKFHD